MRWAQRLFKRGRLEHDLAKELAYHVERRTAELVAEGVDPREAARRVRLEFGGADEIKEACRDARGTRWVEDFLLDCRYALRTMASNKAFTALAALSLALGIGANTAIYSFMDSILLRSLPVRDPESLVTLSWRMRSLGRGEKGPVTVLRAMSGSIYKAPTSGLMAEILPYPAFEVFQKNDSVLSSVFAFRRAGRLNLSIKGQADIASGTYVSGDYFRGLGIPPAAGRLLIPDDDRAGAPAVAVVSLGFSEERFGGAANAAGQSILINNVPFTVVGVTPPEFFGVDPGVAPNVYLPLHANLLLEERAQAAYLDQHYYWIEMMARLRPGVSLKQAQTVLEVPFHQWVESTAETDRQRSDLPSLVLREGGGGLTTLRRQYSKPLYLLMTLVGLILAIACANIANLLLARATTRRREMAVRLSMGAGRLRVIRQLLTESVLLAALGGALGVLFSIWGIRFLTLLLANGSDNVTLSAELNWHVLAVTAGLTLLTGLLFGLAPAIQSTRVDVMPALKEVRAGRVRSRWRISLSHVLVVSQIALSLLILMAAGLFIRTLSNLQSVQLGFNRENLLLFQLNARQAGHRDAEIASFYADLQARLTAVPGVRNVSLSHESLVNAGTSSPISLPGAEQDLSTRLLYVGPGYLTTMQIPMLLGREIGERDQPGSQAVAVVSELFAKKNFGGKNPVGEHLTMGGRDPRDMEIIGVAKDARYGGLKGDVPPVVYIPYNQGSQKFVGQMTYALRTSGDPLSYVNTVRELAHQADARVPVSNITTQTVQIDATISQEIAFAKLCAVFAILALAIACVGLYGTMSYNVARRTNEIGIRMALGAQRGGVIWMVLRQVFLLAIVGLAIGVPAALAASKLVESFLFGMKPNDPLTISVAIAVLVAATVMAGYAPARRASKIDPMVALRHD